MLRKCLENREVLGFKYYRRTMYLVRHGAYLNTSPQICGIKHTKML